MKRLKPYRSGFLRWVFIVIALGVLPLPSVAQELTVVLSSELSPYVEAYDGFREAWGRAVHRVDLVDGQVPQLPAETRIVVTFGGQAALASYPSDVVVIYCLSPGVTLKHRARQSRAVKIAMTPSATEVIKGLKSVQPSLKRLGVFWVSDAQESFLQLLDVAAQQWGVRIVDKRIGGIGDLPDGLRKALRDGIDGVWLPPDPALINARSFGIFRTFSYDNDVPLYVPSGGLLDKGAVASVSCNFGDVGRAASMVAQKILIGDQVPVVVYPEQVTFLVNAKAALETGLSIDLDALKRNGVEVRE